MIPNPLHGTTVLYVWNVSVLRIRVGLRYIGVDGDVYVGGDMKFEKLFFNGIEMNEDKYKYQNIVL